MHRLQKLKRWVANGLARLRSVPRPEKENITRDLIRLAWPIAAAMLGDSAMGLVDTKLVGGLGARALGGVGVAATFLFLGYAIVFGLMRGVKVRTAYAVGRGNPGDGIVYARAGVILGLIAGVVIWIALRDVSRVLGACGIAPSLVEPARDFLAAISFGAPATCVLSALVQQRQGMGDSRSPMIAGLATNVFNAVLAFALIHGRFGFPALGVRGAGFATAAAETLEAIAMYVVVTRAARSCGATTISQRVALREVCELGVPTGLQFGAETLAFTTFTAILGSIGSAEIAAHHLALAIIRVSFLPGIAVSEATSVLVGQSLGRRRLDSADRVTASGLVIAVAFMAVCGIVFAVFGGPIVRAFTSDPATARIARRLLFVAAAFQVLDAVNIVMRGALRGAKDVRVIAIMGISIAWTCVPTAALVFGKILGWGALGGWLGFIAETSLATVLYLWRWKRGAWRRNFVRAPATMTTPPIAHAAA